MPPRTRLHALPVREERAQRRSPRVRRRRRERRDAGPEAAQRQRRAEDPARLLVRRVVPVECRRRCRQPAAQSLARGMLRERLDDLPRHGLPRAARALRLPPRESRRGRLRLRPQRFPRPLRRRQRSGGRPRATLGKFPRQRLVADRLALRARHAAAGRIAGTRVRDRLCRERREREVGERRRAESRGRAAPESAAAGRRSRRARICRAPAPLGFAPRRAAGEHAGRAAERTRQHLESLPVHGDLPARAQRLAVRDRARPRHRLPGLEPGLPRRRPHGPGRGARAPHAPRRHAAERRQRVSPVPAADAHRQQRDRQRVQRRSALAGAERRGLRPRDRPRGPARRAGSIRRRAGWRRDDARSPGGLAPPHARAPRRARTAADRARGLERLPEPQRAFDGPGRILPDRADAKRRPRGIGDDRGALRARRARIRRALARARR